jgi:hypothetical protein
MIHIQFKEVDKEIKDKEFKCKESDVSLAGHPVE